MGLLNERLMYKDGQLSLRYTNGQNYSSGDPRNAQIIFICDTSVGVGTPKYLNEIG